MNGHDDTNEGRRSSNDSTRRPNQVNFQPISVSFFFANLCNIRSQRFTENRIDCFAQYMCYAFILACRCLWHDFFILSLSLSLSISPHCRLKDLLRLRLTECGWNDEVRMLCRDVIKEEGGNVNVERIVKQITPRARSLVPDTVKKELLQKIKTILSNPEHVEMN